MGKFVTGTYRVPERPSGTLGQSVARLGRNVMEKERRKSRARKEEAARRSREEEADAEEWYAERRRKEALSSARRAAMARRDYDLPEDERPIPF